MLTCGTVELTPFYVHHFFSPKQEGHAHSGHSSRCSMQCQFVAYSCCAPFPQTRQRQTNCVTTAAPPITIATTTIVDLHHRYNPLAEVNVSNPDNRSLSHVRVRKHRSFDVECRYLVAFVYMHITNKGVSMVCIMLAGWDAETGIIERGDLQI